MAPAIMIGVTRSGNNNLYHYIVAPDHGERPALATRLSSGRRLTSGQNGQPPARKAPTGL